MDLERLRTLLGSRALAVLTTYREDDSALVEGPRVWDLPAILPS